MGTKVLLTISIAINLALVAAFFTSKSTAPAPTAGEPVNSSNSREEESTPSIASPAPAARFDWRIVESRDYRKYIANLRAIGCPEETIRDIIIADVNKLFESRRKGLLGSPAKFQYWKGEVVAGTLKPDQREKLASLDSERRALLRELLGVDVEDNWDVYATGDPRDSMLDFLSADQQKQIKDICAKFESRMASTLKGGPLDGEAMRQIQKEMDAELAKTLSPEEFRQYQLRMSPTALNLRAQLNGFEVTEEDFGKLFDIKKKFDDQMSASGFGASTPEEQDKLNTAQKDMQRELKAYLGDRYAQYERAQDWNYQGLVQVQEQYNLPKESATKVYDMKRVAEAEAKKIRRDSNLTAEQRTAALQAIRDETETSVRQVLGNDAWVTYKSQASWLNGLNSKSNPGKQPATTSVIFMP